MSLSSVGRALNSSSDGPGSNFCGFNPRLALKQAAKCRSHTKENISQMSFSSVDRELNSRSDGPGSNLGGYKLRFTLKQAAKCRTHTKVNIFIRNLAQLVER